MTAPLELIKYKVSWKSCNVCRDSISFKSPREFCQHLRDFHCSKEGGSYVCHYGMNGVCPSLPIDGVNDKDYDDHVARDHVFGGDSVKCEGEKTAACRTFNNYLILGLRV